jgi:hypothetical protein
MAKQGFSERLYLKYLRTKFKTLAILSPQKAAEIAPRTKNKFDIGGWY